MIGAIADDLSGAAEIGAVGLRHGMPAEVILQGDPSGNADLVCVDTDSRFCPPGEAGRRAAAAGRLLLEHGADWVYKKVDSVLRGQVRPEVEALLQQFGLKQALLVPANPSLGRTIQGGLYFVRGKLIHETEFSRDPEHPRNSPSVLHLLGTTGTSSVGICSPDQTLPGSGIIIGEVGSPSDLDKWAARRSAFTLCAGGAEFFGALLAATAHGLPASQQSPIGPPRLKRRELFVCGSTSEACHEFIELARRKGTPVFSLPTAAGQPGELDPRLLVEIAQQVRAALSSHNRVLLEVGLPLVKDKATSKLLSSYLAQIAEMVRHQGDVDHFYAEGGATAMEVVRRMGWTRLSVLEELAPGVATLVPDHQPALRLTIKPGSYLWPEGLSQK